MRTTLTIEDRIAKALKESAHRSGRSFKEVVNETLRKGMDAEQTVNPKPYRLKPASLGKAATGIDLRKALLLADRIEEEEIARKLEMRK
jgi:hypothetical protein